MSINYIYNYPMVDNSFLKDFNLQYSFNKDPEFQYQYFSIIPSKPGSSDISGLQISIYKDDLTFLKDSKTDPRTELRGLAILNDNVNYTVTWDQYIQEYPNGYWFAFCQIFAKDGPNIILRWKNNQYELLAIQGRNKTIPIKLNILDDLDKWVNWKLEFLLSTNGYVRVYKNYVLVGEISGNTSGGNNSYWKQGIYSQEMQPTNTMDIIIKNLKLYY